MPVTLKLLGSLSVVRDGVEERLPLSRPTSLLIHLALRGGWLDRLGLALLYRPDAEEAEALAYLRKLVFRARKLDWATGLEVEGDALRWQVATDVASFEAAVATRNWSTALAEYSGPLLGGATLTDAPGFTAWQEVQHAALEASWLTAALGRAHELERAGRHGEAASVHRQVLVHDPFAEDSVRAAMRLLLAAGRPSAAREIYEAFKRKLRDELGAAPLESTEALADSLHDLGARPAAAAPQGSRHPQPATPFVGRLDELAEVESLLFGDDERLVTVVGLGGSGKTRLALETLQRAHRDGRDTAFVTLNSTMNAEAVAAAAVDAAGLPWSEQQAERSLVASLRSRELLLVLDNFEVAIETAPLVGRLVAATDRLRVLVTSREPLRLHGERLLDLSGLATPPAGQPLEADDYDAVNLFVQQAARVRPGFAPGPADLSTIGEICRRLAGLPLAIELAAGWIRVLSPGELLARLDADATVLTSNRRDIASRHQSLWNVFDYTWERLSADERSALPQLTVFMGGFGLAAAATVAGAGLEVLLRLLELNLVRRTGEGRFTLHELVRQYALQRAGGEADMAGAVAAHSRYYCSRLATLTPDLQGNDVQAGLDEVQKDFANVLAAWNSAITRGDVEALDGARDALETYLYYRGRFATATDLFGRAAAAVDALAREPGSDRADRLRVAGRLLLHEADHERHQGRLPQSQLLATRALAQLDRAADEVGMAYARLSLGNGEMRLGHYQEADEHLQAVLAAASNLGDTYLEGAAHNGLANLISYTDGDIELAEEHYRASLRAHRRIGNLEGINGALINLGACRYDAHDFEAAESLWEEAAVLAARLGYPQREAVLHNNLGSLSEARGDAVAAKAGYQRSLALRQEIGDISGQANVLHNLGRLANTLGEHQEARRLFEQSLERYLEIDEKAGVAHVRSSLARTLSALGRSAEADAEVAKALALALDIDSHVDILGSLLTIALLRESSGEAAAATSLARTVAVAAAGSSEPLRTQAEELIARLAGEHDDTDSAPAAGDLGRVARRELSALEQGRSMRGASA